MKAEYTNPRIDGADSQINVHGDAHRGEVYFDLAKAGEGNWKDLYLKGAKSLMDNWKHDKDTGEWLWQSQVFGPKRHYYGACHGLAGNANILLQGSDLLPDGYAETIIKRTISTLMTSVKQETNLANWSLCTKPNIDKLLVINWN